MSPHLSLREVLSRSVELTSAEAVAIALQLLAQQDADVDAVPPFGPPSLDNVHLSADGAVVCAACAAAPAVLEIGILFEAMLPRGGNAKVPGGLRYTIARALLEVDAPPFDSTVDLSAALTRYEQGERSDIVRALYARADANGLTAAAAGGDRRRRTTPVAQLRRQLREADEDRFRLSRALRQAGAPTAVAALAENLPPGPSSADRESLALAREPEARFAFAFDPLILRNEPVEPVEFRQTLSPVRWLVGGVLAAAVAFGAGYTLVDQLRSLHPAVRTDRPIVQGVPKDGPASNERALSPTSEEDAAARRVQRETRGARVARPDRLVPDGHQSPRR